MLARLARRVLLAAFFVGVIATPVSSASRAADDPQILESARTALAPLWEPAGPDLPGHRASRAHHARLAPFVATSLPEDAAWEPWIGPGIEGSSPRAVEYHGKLYLTNKVAGHASGGLVAWDGTHFEATPEYPGNASALGVWNDRLVIANGSAPYRIFAFNGTGWDSLGLANGNVVAVDSHGTDLVIVGQFSSVSGVSAKGVARFNGSTWTGMGNAALTGTNSVYAVCEHAGQLVISGQIPAFHDIAIWSDSAASWSPLAGGFNGDVKALASDGVKLYASGNFTLSGATPTVGRAQWDGSAWSQIPCTGTISDAALAIWNGGLVVKGGVALPSRLGFWDGSTLTPMADSIGVTATGVSGNVFQLLNWGGHLVATGNFRDVGAKVSPAVAIFDGVSWSAPIEPWAADMKSPEGFVSDLTTWNDQLVAGGAFSLLADQDHFVRTAGIGSWDGANWSPLGDGVPAQQRWFGTYQGDLIVTGWGAQAVTPGGTTVKSVLRWNGSAWSGFGSPPFDFGFAAREYHGDLYVGFEDNLAGDGIRRWDGSSWTPLGAGLFASAFGAGFGYALATFGDSLVVGGAFETAGGIAAANVAFWDGSAWHAAGAGFDDFALALTVWNGRLIAGGGFTHSGAQAMAGCAVWDGAAWQPFGTNAVEVEKLLSVDGMLFAAGDFRLPDDSVVETVARWDGSDWHVLGSGTNSYAIATLGGYLYNAGNGRVHGHLSHGLSRIPLSATLDVPEPGRSIVRLALSLWPDPARGATRCRFTLPEPGHARVAIFDVSGRTVATLADGPFSAGTHELRWDAPTRPGVYFARIEAGAQHLSRRFVVLER